MFNAKSFKNWIKNKHQNARLSSSSNKLLTTYAKDIGYNGLCVTNVTLDNNVVTIVCGKTICTSPINRDLKDLLSKISTKTSGFVSPKEIINY